MPVFARHFFAVFFIVPFLAVAQSHEIDSLNKVLTTTLPDTSRVNTMNVLARHLRNTQATAALQLAKEAYALAVKNHYTKGVATASDISGVIYLNLGDSRKALYSHLIALNLFEQIDNKRGIAFTYNNIGAVYSHLKNYDRAEFYYLKSLELKKQAGLNREVSSSYVNLGNIKMHEHKIEDCINYYKLGLSNAIKYNDKQNITIGYMNLGEAYYDNKQYKFALSYYKKAEPYIKESGNINHEAHANFAAGKILTDLGEYETAERKFTKALTISKQAGSKNLELNIYKYSSKLYEKWNKPAEAVIYYKKYIQLNDSIYSNETVKTLSEMQSRYDLETKDRQIELLNKDKTIAEATISRDKLVKRFLIAAFLLFVVIVIILVRNIFLKQQVNRVLTVKNEQIEEQQIEIGRQNEQLTNYNLELMKENVSARYEILKSKINPHFLFNSLTTLSNLIITNREGALEFVMKFSKLYRKILDVNSSQLVTIEQEIELVSEFLYIQKIRFNSNLVYSFNIHKTHLKNMVPPFSIQLLVENAVKHNTISKEQKLVIKIFSENDCIIVSNNIQRKENPEESMKVGQKNIFERYKLIGAKSPAFTEEETRYVVSLPIIKKEEVI
ncbi:MAG: tetratricopeptide repeat protein [Bacteroidota bacterium]